MSVLPINHSVSFQFATTLHKFFLKMHSCRMPGCTSVYKNKRDRATHEGVHYVEFGHENALVCEVCCVQHYRRDNLNDHRKKAHGRNSGAVCCG